MYCSTKVSLFLSSTFSFNREPIYLLLRHRFIQPDNSFGTWWNIIERGMNKTDREIHVIQGIHFYRNLLVSLSHISTTDLLIILARPENKLHLSVNDVDEFYSNNKPHTNESWYITPVGMLCL